MNRLLQDLIKVFVMTLLFMTNVPTSFADQDPLRERREQCIAWMMSDYPSGIQEVSCVSEFSLPSAFLFKCAKAERRGYKDELQKKACSLFFAEASKSAGNGFIIN